MAAASASDDLSFGVSVVIPTYNVGDHIARTLDCVLAQSRPAEEIIVVDSSTDRTAAIVKSYGDKVRYIYQEKSGLSAARNAGIAAARCRWIAFLDGDDEWLADKLRLQMERLERNRQLAWAGCNYFVQDHTADTRCVYAKTEQFGKLLKRDTAESPGGYFENFLAAIDTGVGWSPCTMIIERKVFDEVGLFDTSLRFGEDFELFWRIAYRRPQIGYIEKPLCVYHLNRPGSLMGENSDLVQMPTLCDIFDRHLAESRKFGMERYIERFVYKKVRPWMEELYFADRFAELSGLLRRYRKLLPFSYQLVMSFLAISPRLTASLAKRLIGLRRRIRGRSAAKK